MEKQRPLIFEEQIARKPDFYPWTKQYIEAMQNGFWTHREFSFQSDVQNFKANLTPQEREIIVRSLSTIGQLEISVKKFWSKLGENLPHPSLCDIGFVFANSEVIHSDAYSFLLEKLGINDSFEEILKLDIIKGRVHYLKKHLHRFHENNKKQFIYSLILFTLFVENIALFSQFYTIGFFNRYKNLLKDCTKQMEFTAREEQIHSDVGIRIINTIREEYPQLFDKELENKILHESEQAVKYECEIIDWIVNGYEHEKLNSNILKEFIKNRLNKSLEQIGYKPIFEINDALLKKTDWFEEQLFGNLMTDFFDSRPSEYTRFNQSFSEENVF